MGAPVNSSDAGSVTGHRRRLDPALFRFWKRWRHHALELRQAFVSGSNCSVGTGGKPGLAAILRQTLWREEADGIRPDGERFHLSDRGSITPRLQPDGGCLSPAD